MFDNDGTLWCEKPMPIQLDFILRRLAQMAAGATGAAASASRGRPSPSATTAGSAHSWTEHYAGDDTNVRLLARGILAAYAGISVEDFESSPTPSCAARSIRPSVAATWSAHTHRWSNCSAT